MIREKFHLVTKSPWPLLTSIIIMKDILGVIIKIGDKEYVEEYIIYNIIITIGIIFSWIEEIITEGEKRGEHTKRVREGIIKGYIIFILTEIIIFITLFLTHIYLSINPGGEIGGVWPTINIEKINIEGKPLINTIILIISGITITSGHNKIKSGLKKEGKREIIYTILLGIIFTFMQYREYKEATFTITDSIYGGTFYIITGWHGIHIIVGGILLLLTTLFIEKIKREKEIILTISSIYWHLVDGIWLFILILLYL